ncbi:DNA-binding domain-containing protein [Pseudomonas sp. 5P_5.1_Bac1]|uniref:HvfC/BufC N-terminal domain-containing protein n=1 Tax=Pseudomonas sp. 5P_5.1_Bac1 TaxID=2971616 RepID=UPI0021C79C8C|nr:DNA-binding domain-containing protein [Pseudomonas sp. 5P_5.1_Bac1]MCU1725105.1 DNA-binding domain-containing protein [Pseudomonas sp. 5P_5.1_Bac1]
MNLTLGQFQDAFVASLYGNPAEELAALTEQPAFAVYRNTVLAGAVDALCANFPSVERLVGYDWMHGAAAAYAQLSPPGDPRLIRYGAGFPDFLDEQTGAQGTPWLADVARLDFDWAAAFSAPVDPSLDLTELAGMSAADLARCHLRPRRGVRWRWFPLHPVFSLWRHNREGLDWPPAQPWIAEGALLTGDADGVIHHPLDAGGCAFLDACAVGHALEQAALLAEKTQPDLDFNDLLGRLLQARVFLPLSLA